MRKLIVVAALVANVACAWSGRTVGMHDPVIDVVKAMTEAQTASVRAIMEAFTKAQSLSCAVPTAEVLR